MPGSSEPYRLAYDEAVRSLETQERSVIELRSRAGVLVGAAAVATSFLGGAALHGQAPGAAGVAALVLFVAAGAAALSVLLPRDDWVWRNLWSWQVTLRLRPRRVPSPSAPAPCRARRVGHPGTAAAAASA